MHAEKHTLNKIRVYSLNGLDPPSLDGDDEEDGRARLRYSARRTLYQNACVNGEYVGGGLSVLAQRCTVQAHETRSGWSDWTCFLTAGLRMRQPA